MSESAYFEIRTKNGCALAKLRVLYISVVLALIVEGEKTTIPTWNIVQEKTHS